MNAMRIGQIRTLTVAFLGVLFLLIPNGCRRSPAVAKNEERKIQGRSIIALIADPEEFDGKYVIMVGYLAVSQGEARFFLHKEDRTYIMLANSLIVDLTHADIENGSENGYVMIRGRFRAGLDMHGCVGVLDAELVQRIVPP